MHIAQSPESSVTSLPLQRSMEPVTNLGCSHVVVHRWPHRYSFGTRAHKVGDNHNGVAENLVVLQ